MGKSALLIGCNYPGTKAALKGCVNDVWEFKQTLLECMGFDEGDIAIMVDTDKEYTQPTGKNIKDHLSKMVAEAKDGDLLFLHFSGHGTQLPTTDEDEPDGLDECICPTDMHIITDDILTVIFAPLAWKDVKLTFVADCCHSGTLLDHPQVIITGPKEGRGPAPTANARALESMMAALGTNDDEESRDIKNRSLPFDDYKEMLSGKLGGVDFGDLPASLIRAFGEDSTGRWKEMFEGIARLQQSGFDMTFRLKGVRVLAESVIKMQQIEMQRKEPLNENVGILLSGCMERECAADVKPRNSEPHGAFSHTVNMLLRQMHKEGTTVTYRNLILGVRDSLSKRRFKQSPCLEGSEKWADTAFILRD